MGRREIVVRLVVTGAVGVAAVGFLLPLLWAAATSLKGLEEVYAYPPRWAGARLRWENFGEAVVRLPFGRFVWNSVVISAWSVGGTVLSTSLTGYALSRLRGRVGAAWLVVLLASIAIPPLVLVVPEYVIFRGLGWLNTYKPLIVPAWLATSGLYVFLFRQYFLQMPRWLADAALVDGATAWQAYWHVALPAARPAVVTVAALSFVGSWHALLRPMIYLADFDKLPVSVGLRMYQTMEGSWVNLLMAASLVATVPVVVVFVVAQSQIMRGLGLGGAGGARE